jgi:dephospho-CoA kinase
VLQIGITGGIGSGKSTVSRVFRLLGIPVLNADEVAKRLMQEDASIQQSIIQQFGDAAYSAGKLNRQYLAQIVFNDEQQLAKLNAITHPATIQYSNNWAQLQVAPYVIKEAALLFESGSYKELDKIIGVYAPENVRLKRAAARDGASEEAIRKRMQRQMNEDEKMARCDYIIKNDETISVIEQVLSLHQTLLDLKA